MTLVGASLPPTRRSSFFRGLQALTVRASRIRAVRALLVFGYHVQWRLFLVLFRGDRHVGAIILRRAQSLRDLYPGDSDLDPTCVFDPPQGRQYETARRLTNRYRALKRWLPVLGELHLVPIDEFPLHFRYCRHLYCAERVLHVAYLRPGTLLPPDWGVIAESYGIRTALNGYYRVSADAVRDPGGPRRRGRRFSRALLKNIRKVEWMLAQRRGDSVGELSYQAIDTDRYLSRRQRWQAATACLSSIALSVPTPGRELDDDRGIEFHGRGELKRPDQWAALSLALEPFIRDHRARIRRLTLSQYRPYKFDRLILIELRDATAWAGSPSFFSALNHLHTSLERTRQMVFPNPPLVTESSGTRGIFGLDPLLAALHEVEGYDFLAAEYYCRTPRRVAMTADLLRCEIMAAVDGIWSELAGGECQLFLDLLFGRLLPARLALTRGVFPVSLDALMDLYLGSRPLDRAQQRLLHLYRRGDLDAIESFGVSRAWEVLGSWLVEELEESVSAVSIHRTTRSVALNPAG